MGVVEVKMLRRRSGNTLKRWDKN